MYTIDKDYSRLEIAFMCSKSVLSPHLTFVEVGRRRFLRFPRTSSSLIQIFIECEQQLEKRRTLLLQSQCAFCPTP